MEAQVTGGGTTVWLATYTTHCPDGSSKSFQAPASAMWWPVDPYQSMSAITVSTRKDNSVPVNGMMGKGVVHLRKAGVDPQPTAQE